MTRSIPAWVVVALCALACRGEQRPALQPPVSRSAPGAAAATGRHEPTAIDPSAGPRTVAQNTPALPRARLRATKELVQARPNAVSQAAAQDTPELLRARLSMVKEQLEERGVRDARVLAAMREVPRHAFVAERIRRWAYEDGPLPIEAHQTISQPYIVAFMTELAQLSAGDKVLEVGTGSGYQAAVLAALGARVYSIEIVAELANSARERLQQLGYAVQVRHGDGYAGWPDAAPFDAILVTAAPPSVPQPLREQLAIGGKLIVPVGEDFQDLLVITRTEHGFTQKSVLPVRFVPMTGKAQQRP